MQRNPKSTSDSTDSNSPNSQPKLVKASDLPPELAERTDYIDVKELGQGGMGMVYLATNKMLARQEVLKVVGRQHLSRPGAKDRFLQEIQSAARLQHSNVVMAYAAIQANESIIFAMEYAPGTDLQKHVKANGPLSVQMACHHSAHTALGLQHAHEKKMVHRDIKPANLMLTRDGKKPVVKILDFGLAKITSEQDHNVATDDDGSQPQDTGLTRQGQMMGTPDYVAPEQILDAAKADIRADIYSLGCTLYFLLTGKPPFRATKLAELLSKHLKEMPTPLNEIRPDVPKELADIVFKMLAKKPADRYQSPAEVANALKPFLKPPGAKVSTSDTVTTNPESGGQKNSATVAPQAWDTMLVDTDNDTVDEIKTKRRGSPSGQPPWLFIGIGGGLVALLFIVVTIVFVLKSKDAPNKPEVAEKPTTPSKPVKEESKTTKTTKEVELKPTVEPKPVEPRVKPPEAFPQPDITPNPKDPKPGQERVVDIGNGLKMTFCWVPRGKALLGSPLSEPMRANNEQEHVFETNGFWLAKHELRQEIYDYVMNAPINNFPQPKFKGPDLPVEMLSWFASHQFMQRCSYLGFRLRFPTEDEWEYANRGGKPNKFPFYWGTSINGSESNILGAEHYSSIPLKEPLRQVPSIQKTTPVGLYEKLNPHPWNLCDMTGNVWEWCDRQPELDSAIYPMRGGSWITYGNWCRAAKRVFHPPEKRLHDVGLRPVLVGEDGNPADNGGVVRIPKRKWSEGGRYAEVMYDDVWELDNEILKMKKPSDWFNMIIFGNPLWKNYEFQFKVKKVTNSHPHGVGAIFLAPRFDNRFEFYYGGYNLGKFSELCWYDDHRLIRGKNPKENQELIKPINPMVVDRWYEYVVNISDGRYIAKIDGTEIFRYSFGVPMNGKVGFRTSPGMFHFKDIKVTAPDGKILWEGLPELP